MFAVFLPKAAAQQNISVQNAVVNQYQTSLQLPAGSTTYLYCMDSGGAYASEFTYGEYAYATTQNGNIGASLASTTSNQNSYSYDGSYYSIGGIGVSRARVRNGVLLVFQVGNGAPVLTLTQCSWSFALL